MRWRRPRVVQSRVTAVLAWRPLLGRQHGGVRWRLVLLRRRTATAIALASGASSTGDMPIDFNRLRVRQRGEVPHRSGVAHQDGGAKRHPGLDLHWFRYAVQRRRRGVRRHLLQVPGDHSPLSGPATYNERTLPDAHHCAHRWRRTRSLSGCSRRASAGRL